MSCLNSSKERRLGRWNKCFLKQVLNLFSDGCIMLFLPIHPLSIFLSSLTPILFSQMKMPPIFTDFCSDRIYGFNNSTSGQLTFPDNDYIPSFGFQTSPDFLVSFSVSCDLDLPKIRVGLRGLVILAILMTMPETPMNKDNGAILWENNVRRTRVSSVVCTVTEPKSPKCMS